MFELLKFEDVGLSFEGSNKRLVERRELALNAIVARTSRRCRSLAVVGYYARRQGFQQISKKDIFSAIFLQLDQSLWVSARSASMMRVRMGPGPWVRAGTLGQNEK